MPYLDLDKILKETILGNKCHPLKGLNYSHGSSIRNWPCPLTTRIAHGARSIALICKEKILTEF